MLDRLLQKVLALTVRTGTLRVTTVAGTSFTVGDGTGAALALRFTTRAAEIGIGAMRAYEADFDRIVACLFDEESALLYADVMSSLR